MQVGEETLKRGFAEKKKAGFYMAANSCVLALNIKETKIHNLEGKRGQQFGTKDVHFLAVSGELHVFHT